MGFNSGFKGLSVREGKGGGDACHSPPHTADVKNEASYSTTSDCVFMANTVTNLPLRLLFALRRITFLTELYFGFYILVCNT
jgi:hypothetical protein